MLFILISVLPAIGSSVNIEYFHMPGCHDCAKTDPLIMQMEKNYPNVTFEWVDTSTPSGLSRWERYGFTEVPALVINNETRISKENITGENVNASINAYLNNSVISGHGCYFWSWFF
jgi:glutaredoxin